MQTCSRKRLGKSLAACGLILWMFAAFSHAAELVPDVRSALMITNVWQMRHLLGVERRVLCNFRLQGVVCAAIPEHGLLVLQDPSGTEELDLDWSGGQIKPGQRIMITASKSSVSRSGNALAIARGLVVDNDGTHGMVEKSGDVYLAAGMHSLCLDWFNGHGPFGLTVSRQGPGLPRGEIPDSALFQARPDPATGNTNFINGLHYQCYEAHPDREWARLPDFNQLAAVKSGTSTNFNLGIRTENENVGLRFTGYFEAPRDGFYSFQTISDDGSRLYIGEPSPQIELLSQEPPPAPHILADGQYLMDGKESEWAELTGTVTFVNKLADGLELELGSGINSMRVMVENDTGLSPIMLLHAEVRAVGVCHSISTANGQKVVGFMSVPDATGIHPLSAAPDLWNDYPVVTIGAVRQSNFSQPGEPVVRVRGQIRALEPDASLTLEDASGLLLVKTSQRLPNAPGDQVEALGRRSASGTNLVLECAFYRLISGNAGKLPEPLPTLTTAEAAQQLKPEEAARGYPVKIRGIITSVVPEYEAVVIQDSTRGIYVDHLSPDICDQPQIGDYWEIEGVTAPSYFAPLIRGRHATLLGTPGHLPEPLYPNWDQLMNGSLDGQYVEIQGVVTAIRSHEMTLLMRMGSINLNLIDTDPVSLERYQGALVRIRGCLFASWNALTHQVLSGEIRFYTASLDVDQWAPVDPYQAPEKRVADLRLFDLHASRLKRVKVSGEIIHGRKDEYFMMDGMDGIRILLKSPEIFSPGDTVEAVGFPELVGSASVIREAVARRIGHTSLPKPRTLGPAELFRPGHDSTYVRLEGQLVNLQNNTKEQVLEIQVGLRTFLVRLRSIGFPASSLPLGSRLELTGVYADGGSGRNSAEGLNSFELLLNSYPDIQVLARPPWLTLKRLLVAAGALLAVLFGALVWIRQLHLQVEKRSALLRMEIHERERAEHQHALEEERSRIARDLHDDLGSSLTEISMVAETGRDAPLILPDSVGRFGLILDRTRGLVRALDEIVWAVDPSKDTLSALVKYLAGFAEEYSSSAGLWCQVEIPITINEFPLAAGERHQLFLAVKEALTNIIRHARARKITFQITLAPGRMKVFISDDGRGFDPAVSTDGNGLGNMCKRLADLGGGCEVDSRPGAGARILFIFPLPARNQSC